MTKITETQRNLHGGIGLQFGRPPTGLQIAASLIPAHQALAESGFSSRFSLPFARKSDGVRVAMGLDESGNPKFNPNLLAQTELILLQLRGLALFENEEAEALGAPIASRRADVEVRPYANHQRQLTLTLQNRIGRLVVAPGLELEEHGLSQEARVQALIAAKEMVEVVSATMIDQLAEFQPAQFDQ